MCYFCFVLRSVLLATLYLHCQQVCDSLPADSHVTMWPFPEMWASLCAVFTCEYVQICKRKTKLCKPNVCRSVQPPSFMHFILFVFYYGVCSWMELWIWTRGAASVQPSGSWGGGRLRTWRQLWLARDFDPHASISRRTRRTSTGEAAHTDTQMSVLMTVY